MFQIVDCIALSYLNVSITGLVLNICFKPKVGRQEIHLDFNIKHVVCVPELNQKVVASWVVLHKILAGQGKLAIGLKEGLADVVELRRDFIAFTQEIF